MIQHPCPICHELVIVIGMTKTIDDVACADAIPHIPTKGIYECGWKEPCANQYIYGPSIYCKHELLRWAATGGSNDNYYIINRR